MRAEAAGETLPERLYGRRTEWYLADVEEDNAYVATCKNNHTVKALLQHVRYELLYESGIVASLVGFQREAVSSIAAALERFYEFAIEVFTLCSGVDPQMHEAAWKQVKKQSERQFGAFLFLHLANFKRPFLAGKAWSTYEDWVKFRNDIIHQGRFPSRVEAMKYARHVYELIRDAQAALKELDAEAVQKIQLRYMHRSHEVFEKKFGSPEKDQDGQYLGPSSTLFPLMLSAARASPTDFDSRLATAKHNLAIWGFSDVK